MTRVVIDSALFDKLASAPGPVTLCDEDGFVVGTFEPTKEADWRNPPFSEEELDRRFAEKGGRTMAEIRADLEKRA